MPSDDEVLNKAKAKCRPGTTLEGLRDEVYASLSSDVDHDQWSNVVVDLAVDGLRTGAKPGGFIVVTVCAVGATRSQVALALDDADATQGVEPTIETTKEAAPKKKVAKKTRIKKVTPTKSVVKKTIATTASSKKTVAKKTVAKKTTVKKASPKKVVTKTTTKKAVAKKAVPKKASPQKASAKKSLPKKTTRSSK